ncbi:MAG: RNA-binding S4 domain-containing protein [Oscillospiraceae bacterium]|nr:RNA-binding S4 domain-containing protein [Oscillospiraceae bacterium]
MRIDKYLKVSRIIKRRTVANEACDSGRIQVGGKQVKASYDVKIGDVIEITLGSRPLTVRVVSVAEHTTKESAADLYEIIN